MFADLTTSEEELLPLPVGWIRSYSSVNEGLLYKNIRSGLESEEHPFVMQAMNHARKLPLPPGWVVKEAQLSDGTIDYFYCNPAVGISNWDPPYLRSSLADILEKNGFHSAAAAVRGPQPPITLSNSLAGSSSSVHRSEPPPQPARDDVDDNDSYTDHRLDSLRVEDLRESIHANHSVPIFSAPGSLPSAAAPLHPTAPLLPLPPSQDDGEEEYHDTYDYDFNDNPEEEGEEVLGTIGNPGSYGGPSLGQRNAVVDEEEFDDDDDDDDDEDSYQALHQRGSSEERKRSESDELKISSGTADHGGRDGEEKENEEEEVDFTVGMSQSAGGPRGRSDTWLMVRSAIQGSTSDNQPQTHRILFSKPPVSDAGVRVLRADTVLAYERVNELIVRLRMELSLRAGLDCGVLQYDPVKDKFVKNPAAPPQEPTGGDSAQQLHDNEVYSFSTGLRLAGYVVDQLREHPEIITATMRNASVGSLGMVSVAFTVLHRLLHPFNSDPSLTTALLLEGINVQVDEANALVQAHVGSDSTTGRVLLSRVLFVSDPVTAMGWNPLGQPMPMVPNVPVEPVLACLLRVYCLRRDVASYYRSIWHAVLPAVGSVVATNVIDAEVTFSNLFSVASRMLECTFSVKSIALFPAAATAVSRALLEVGGHEALFHYLLNFLLLPNLLKIVSDGDHESFDNEMAYREPDHLEEFYDRYFDMNIWWPVEGFASVPFDPCCSLIWIIWRLFSAAVSVNSRTLLSLKASEFFVGGPPLDISGVSDVRLRKCLDRLRRKIFDGVALMVDLPLDSRGNHFLSVDALDSLQRCERRVDIQDVFKKRLSTLLQKPDELLSHVTITRFELFNLVHDVRSVIESSTQTEEMELLTLIDAYLKTNEERDVRLTEYVQSSESELEDIMVIPLPRNTVSGSSDSCVISTEQHGMGRYLDQHMNISTQDGVSVEKMLVEVGDDPQAKQRLISLSYRHQQLCCGLLLANRYEDSLLRMLNRLEKNQRANINDLIEENSWYHKPEFDITSVQPAAYTTSGPGGRPAVGDKLARNKAISKLVRHTQASRGKMLQPHHGLGKSIGMDAVSSKRPQSWGEVSLRNMHDQVFSTYRFGLATPKVNVGTSMGRTSKCLPPPLPPSAGGMGSVGFDSNGDSDVVNQQHKYHRSRYTKFDVNPDSGFLVKTESARHQQFRPPKTWQDKENAYKKSLRDHEVIPTAEFLQKKQKMMLLANQARRLRMMRERSSSGGGHDGMREEGTAQAARPFPEHLRHRIREDQSHIQARRNINSSNESDWDEVFDDDEDNSVEIAALLKDYATVVAPAVRRGGSSSVSGGGGGNRRFLSSEDQSQPRYDDFSEAASFNFERGRSRSPSSTSSRMNGRRSPTMPDRPWEGAGSGKYFAPTESLLNKFTAEMANAENPIRNKFFRDVAEGVTPGLRESLDMESSKPTPFLPTGKKIVPSTGARIPRMLLSPSSPTASEGSGSRGRSRSRASSPGSNRSGSRSRSRSRSRGAAARQLRPEGDEPPLVELAQQPPLADPSTHAAAVQSPPYRRKNPSHNSSVMSRPPPQSASREDDNDSEDVEDVEMHAPRGFTPAVSPKPSPVLSPVTLKKAIPVPKPVEEKAPLPMSTPVSKGAVSVSLPTPAAPASSSRSAEVSAQAPPASLQPSSPTPPQLPAQSLPPDPKPTRQPHVITPDTTEPQSISDKPHSPPRIQASGGGGSSGGVGDAFTDSANQADGSGPPKSPGILRRKTLNRDAFSLIETLTQGVKIVKHGRNGGSKERVLKLNENDKCLQWSVPAARRSSIFSFVQSSTSSSSSNAQAAADKDRMLLEDIQEVRRGLQTEVMLKLKGVDPSCSCSIVSSARSLDVTLATPQDRDQLVRGLKAVLADKQQVRYL